MRVIRSHGCPAPLRFGLGGRTVDPVLVLCRLAPAPATTPGSPSQACAASGEWCPFGQSRRAGARGCRQGGVCVHGPRVHPARARDQVSAGGGAGATLAGSIVSFSHARGGCRSNRPGTWRGGAGFVSAHPSPLIRLSSLRPAR